MRVQRYGASWAWMARWPTVGGLRGVWLWFSCVCPTVMCHGSCNAHQRRTTLEDAIYQWLLHFSIHL